MTWQEVGRRIREVREQLGLTQDSVARHLGVTRPVVSNIEQGKRPLTLAELDKLADLFGYSPSHFLQGEPDDTVAVIFRARELDEEDLARLAWLHGFLRDFREIRDRMGV